EPMAHSRLPYICAIGLRSSTIDCIQCENNERETTKLSRPGRGLLGKLFQVLLPIITGQPIVLFLNNLRSSGMCQGSLLDVLSPINRLGSWATVIVTVI